MTTELHRIALPSFAESICAITQSYIFIEMRTSWDPDSQMQLTCFDFEGKQLWERDFTVPYPHHYPHALKVANQAVWLSNGKQIYRLDADGVATQVISVPLSESEYIGDYVVTHDGFY